MAQQRNVDAMTQLFDQLASGQDDPSSICCFEFVLGLQATPKFAHCSQEELTEMFFDVAADGVIGEQDYSITKEEFINALCLKDPKSVQDVDLKECFQSFDDDGSGAISAGELRPKLEAKGWNFNDEQFERLIKQADVNGDGTINYEEFRKAFRVDK